MADPVKLGRELGRSFVNTPWKVSNELRRIASLPVIRVYFWLNGVKWGSGYRVYGRPIIQRARGSTIECGANLTLRSFRASNPLVPSHPVVLSTRRRSARIEIGSAVGVTGGTICADQSITIGHRVFVGANTTIVDTDFHPLDPELRLEAPHRGVSAAISIGSDVFIGMGCIILKGVTIGDAAVVGAGSVVSRDIPERAIAAGNPARVVRQL